MSFYGNSSSGSGTFPPVILNLMIANGLIFFLQWFFSGGSVAGMIETYMALWPLGLDEFARSQGYSGHAAGFYPWQVVTYAFLHGGPFHLFWNMFILWMFGKEIEEYWGAKRFLLYYFFCVIGAGLIQLIASTYALNQLGQAIQTVGASGGVLGVLLAFGMMFPHRRILLLIPPIPIEARFMVILVAGADLFLGFGRFQTGVAHFAHLGGMLFGFLLILYWRGKLPIKPKQKVYW